MMRHWVAVFVALAWLSPAQADEVELEIDRVASLTEQVLLESDLRQDTRVALLLPHMLAHDRRSYRIRTTDNAAWLVNWLTRRGFEVQRTSSGWRAF
ncbi:MAG: hypothetical protein D6678_04060 [Zetaproteobacteria bacterium]|nr:MAG: hypothetical protein D6678_04060 [Zetaproteobacteria bacterium]